ncbi:MAG: ABC transporter ATP-binding protein [Candidatus Acidiferrales bacterium]
MNRLASTAIAVEEGQTGASGSGRPVLRTEGLRKEFCSGGQEIVPLAGIDLSVEAGELIAIVGPSGSGKSTFLHLLAALDTPTSGAVYFAGNSLLSLSESALADYRNRSVGFVWQRHHLLPDFTAAENVAIPILVQGAPVGEALRTAEGWLGEVGLASRAQQRAGELSGGEQQRVAIARALVNGPVLLLADEPTGDLDERSAIGVFDLIERLHRSHRLTTILATHNLSLARRADRLMTLHRGQLAPGAEAVAGEAVALRQTVGFRPTDPGGLG